MSWLRKAADLVRVLSLRDPKHWRNTVAGDVASGEPVTEASVLALSAAWACVNLLAGTIASLPIMVYRLDAAGRRVEARDHPLYRILHDSPNADQTALDFWEFAAAAVELRGNFHARIDRSGERIVGLTPVGVDVDCRRDQTGGLRYRWSEDGQSFDLPQRDVFHVRGFGGSPLGGRSTLSHGRNVFGLAQAVDRAAGSTFRTGMRPAGVLTMPGVLKADQRDEIEQGLQRKFAGAMNTGRPMVLEGGVTWQALTISPEDAQMLESRGFSVEEICRIFGVPPFMIGHTEKTTSWGTGLEQQILGFQKFTLRRRLKRIELALRKQLLTPADRAAGVFIEFNLEGLLRADSVARTTFYASALQNGWMTVNEVRSLENLPPVAGGDVPRVQAQNVPLVLSGLPQGLAPPAKA